MSSNTPNRFVGRKKGQAAKEAPGGRSHSKPQESVDDMSMWFREFEEWTNPSFNVLEVMANGCMVHAWMHGGIMSCIRNGPTPPTSEPC